MKKANAVFEKMNIFKGASLTQSSLKPMFNDKLEKKQAKEDRKQSTGK